MTLRNFQYVIYFSKYNNTTEDSVGLVVLRFHKTRRHQLQVDNQYAELLEHRFNLCLWKMPFRVCLELFHSQTFSGIGTDKQGGWNIRFVS
jgi:hypothetical protein